MNNRIFLLLTLSSLFFVFNCCSPVGGNAISASSNGAAGADTAGVEGPTRTIRFWPYLAGTTGNIGGRAGADALCAASGGAGGCTTVFALASFSATDEIRDLPVTKNFSSSSSFTNFAGTFTFANSFTQMIAGAGLSLNGNPHGGGDVWTGSDSSGALSANNCSGFSSVAGNGTFGEGASTTATYLNNGAGSCNTTKDLYCMCY